MNHEHDHHSHNTPRLEPRTLLLAGAGLGALMVGLALGWIALRGRAPGALFPPAPWPDLLLGVLVGVGFAAAEWVVFRYTGLMRSEVALIDRLIDLRALRWYHVAAIVALAALPEELLFRGALVPDIGWLGAALLFGLAHALSWRYFVYASVAGGLLGLLMVWTNGLWAPVAAHAAIDAVVFMLLIRQRPPGGWGLADGQNNFTTESTEHTEIKRKE